MIEIDGSFEEGGGQIIRTALALSTLTRNAFRISNIRKNRPKPGLKQQHVSCIKACAELCNATVDGNKINSESVEFIPRQLKNKQMEINIGTAGSITLLLQSVMLPIMFIESDIRITGGTDVKWSIPIDYFRDIIMPILNDYCSIELIREKRGYYPEGEGVVNIKTKPISRIIDFDDFAKFHQYVFGRPAINLHKTGKLMLIKGISHASKNLQNKEVAEKQAKSAEVILRNHAPNTIVEKEYSEASSTGSGITLYALYEFDEEIKHRRKQYRIGGDALGERNTRSEEVAKLACEKLIKEIESGTVVDEHLQDNLIPLLGLFGGKIKTGKITDHTKANIYVCEKFLDVEYIIESVKSISNERNTAEKTNKDKKDEKGNIEKEKKRKENQIEANFISVLSSRRS